MQTLRLVLLAAIAAQHASSQTAEGFIQIGSDRRELRHARAHRIADDLDKSKQMIHLVLSEAPIPIPALFDGMKLFDIRQSTNNQMVEFNFRENGVNWSLSSKAMEGTRSLSQSPNLFPYQISGAVMKGKIEARSDPDSTSTPYEIVVSYSAPLEKEVIRPPPTPADTAAAQKHPATKAYLELNKAIQSGDKARILAMAPAGQAELMEKNFDEMLKFVRATMPANIKVLKAVEQEGETTLTLTGVDQGKPTKGEATMKLTEGKWVIGRQSWHASK